MGQVTRRRLADRGMSVIARSVALSLLESYSIGDHAGCQELGFPVFVLLYVRQASLFYCTRVGPAHISTVSLASTVLCMRF